MPAAAFATRLVAWQRRHGRQGLPWQGVQDPYRVWLSEVMLQQTQVATVLAFYPRFLARFPDVHALAAAPLDAVLALWSGMGYYSRARNLHRCAQTVVARHGGEFPRDAATLSTLPGIGESTAAAIAAFCFGAREAILDGNVKRVLARHAGFGDDLARPAAVRALWAIARERLPRRGIESYTQGLMDLGATLCTARAPRCGDCPVRGDCVALAESRVPDYPVKTRRTARPQVTMAVLWLRWRDAVWLAPRPPGGIWGGLWAPPAFESDAALAALCHGWPGIAAPLPGQRHVLTHRELWLQRLHWVLPKGLPAARVARLVCTLPSGGRWCTQCEALALGLPAPVRQWVEALGADTQTGAASAGRAAGTEP